jgi:glycosyltransferase involved in cell wall biosynthesis
MKISVCIPTYEANGQGVFFLKKNIDSILSQTYTNFEIIVSDHSTDNEIKNYISSLKNERINYLRYTENIGWPAFNTNNAIKNSTGDYIKLMNLDDYIEGPDTFEMMISILKEGYKWLISGCKHYDYNTEIFYNPIIPRIEGDGTHLLKGVNYVGCPSVGLIPKNEFFDTNVKYMIDCEIWYRLFKKYGYPGVLKDYRIVIGMGSHTLTNQLVAKHTEWLNDDIKYCAEIFLK